MGRIVKGGGDRMEVATMTTEDVVALLALARAEANREREAARDAAIVLARKMAEKIVGHAVAVDPAVMGDIAASALAAARPGKAAVVLRVHPEDVVLLGQARTRWLTEIGSKADLKLVADASVGRFGCVVETAVGRLDARLQTQLDVLEQALRGVGIGRA